MELNILFSFVNLIFILWIPIFRENLNSDDEKKRIESLWNDFLGGSESSNDALKKT